MTEEERSHDGYLKQALEDYEHTYEDWDIELMIDQIIILSDYVGKFQNLIYRMKRDLIDNYREKGDSSPSARSKD